MRKFVLLPVWLNPKGDLPRAVWLPPSKTIQGAVVPMERGAPVEQRIRQYIRRELAVQPVLRYLCDYPDEGLCVYVTWVQSDDKPNGRVMVPYAEALEIPGWDRVVGTLVSELERLRR